ncbi:MAG: VWA domain-containing protein [bacterium]
MPRLRKRQVTTFSLSFLDIMACGFGAVTLLFLLLKHDVEANQSADPSLSAEVNLLREDIRVGQADLVKLKNSLADIEDDIVDASGLSSRVVTRIDETRREISAQKDPEEEIALLRKQVEELEKETADLEEQGRDADLRTFVGQGDRQYLTGLKLGGRRVLILLDASASMLSETIVNVVRQKNMDQDSRRRAAKWQRAVKTTEWIVAQLPPQTTFQIYLFNTRAEAVLPQTAGQWLDPADTAMTDRLFSELRRRAPEGGTSLVNAFQSINTFAQRTDNLFLITDGLPTQGATVPNGNTVSGRQRVKFFNEAGKLLPRGLPLNVILFPMEGDPQAAAAFWQLSIAQRGSFLAPSRDWP